MEGDLARALGQNLRALREANGLSQEELAEVLDVHRTYAGGLERGERNLSLRSVERLAKKLKTTPSALLFGSTEPWPKLKSPRRAGGRR